MMPIRVGSGLRLSIQPPSWITQSQAASPMRALMYNGMVNIRVFLTIWYTGVELGMSHFATSRTN